MMEITLHNRSSAQSFGSVWTRVDGAEDTHGDTTMSDSALGDALVIVHPLLAPILEQNIAQELAPAIWRTTTRSALFTNSRLPLCDLPDTDWRQLLQEGERGEPRLLQLFSARSGPALYFGTVPVPIALELGRRLGPTHRVLAYYSGPRPSSR
jgi:hypothetical protein